LMTAQSCPGLIMWFFNTCFLISQVHRRSE
jgi:hypothetical protein